MAEKENLRVQKLLQLLTEIFLAQTSRLQSLKLIQAENIKSEASARIIIFLCLEIQRTTTAKTRWTQMVGFIFILGE